jgi:predicted lipid-binding transport protein (Tim44 family)
VHVLNTYFFNRRVRVKVMVYCPKCGNEVDEAMAFCPRCGAPLKMEAPVQAAPARQRSEKAEKGEKQEKNEKQEPEKGEKHEKGQYGFAGWLVGGLVLILIGFFLLLQFAGYLNAPLYGALLLLVIGVIVIIAAVYFANTARRRSPPPS